MSRSFPLGLALLLLSGCAASGPSPTPPDTPAPSDGGTGGLASTSAAPPPGWTQDPCDTGEPEFSGNARPADTFRRTGNADNARLFAAHVVEGAGDALQEETTPDALPGRNDARAWQTERGHIAVFWDRDPAAWSADYTSTLTVTQEAQGRNATAHAILGSLQVGTEGIRWTETDTSIAADRALGGAAMTLLHITDQTVQAEQAELVRRQVIVSPDYVLPGGGLLASEAARSEAAAFLECRNAQGGTLSFQVVGGHPAAVVYHSSLAYWFLVEPVDGWDTSCGRAAEGRLHVALDAATGTVLSSDLGCGGAA